MKMSESGQVPLGLFNHIVQSLWVHDDRVSKNPTKLVLRITVVSAGNLEIENEFSSRYHDREKRRRYALKDKEKHARSKGKRGKQKAYTRPKPRRPQVHRPAMYR